MFAAWFEVVFEAVMCTLRSTWGLVTGWFCHLPMWDWIVEIIETEKRDFCINSRVKRDFCIYSFWPIDVYTAKMNHPRFRWRVFVVTPCTVKHVCTQWTHVLSAFEGQHFVLTNVLHVMDGCSKFVTKDVRETPGVVNERLSTIG